MPTVPVIPTQVQDPVRQAQFSAGGVVPVQPQQPGQLQRIGQQMEQAGQQWEALAVERQRRVDIAAHTEREAAVGEKYTEKISSYRQKQGKAAEDGYASLVKEFDDLDKAALDSSPEGPQREWMRESLTKRRSSVLAEATRHRDVQITAWRKASAATSLNQSVDEAIKRMDAQARNPAEETSEQDGEQVKSLLDVAADKAREMAQIEGLDETATNALVAGTMAQIHQGRVEALLADGNRTGEAAAYFAEHRDEIPAQNLPAIQKKLTAAVIEGTARKLTSNFYRFEDRLKWVDEKFQGSADDKESLRRHLIQQANLQDAADAQVAADVEKRARQWMAENPDLDIMRDAPELAAEVTRYGVDVRRTRTTDQAWKDSFYDASPAELDRLRALDDNQLHRYLASRLDAHDEATVTKFLRGDQSGASIGERTKVLARQLGILPSGNRDARPEENRAFDAWVANTIDPMIRKRRDELKRDLNVDDFQKLIVNPILQDKVWQSVTGRDVQKPLAEFQQSGAAPVDDPLTPQDESQDFSSYNSFYVTVGGQEVYLREVPLEQRKAIRDDFARANPGQQMTVEEEIKRWVAGGRKGDLKPKFDAEKKTAGMVDPAEWPMQIGPSRRDHIWSDGKSIRQGSTAAPK